ncbi:MAG: glycosyltransferase family 2 protein [Bacteroidetes bacterium]|nr:MAG: glycosyltransferase family 2 protein [Bacteroidota bacterium]
MKVSGFSFIKDALKYDYPVVEAITSILPICDEFVVAVGQSTDETLNLIRQIDKKKIKIIETQWDESLREGGRVLAVETDKALAQIAEDSDWAFYIQGDEVVHEKYLDTIYQSMLRYKDDFKVDGLLFNYLHFYGSYDYVGSSSNWYSHEIRVIRNDKSIYSYRDAQGFRKGNNQKLCVKSVDAYVYHYGWVKDPRKMQKKQETFHKYWHDDNWLDEHVAKAREFNYEKHVRQLRLFDGEHPAVMKKRIAEKNWQFDFDISRNKTGFKDRLKKWLAGFGIVLGYKNYKTGRC